MMFCVTPTDDEKEHDDYSTVCWCEPKVEFYDNGNTLIIHNAADCRELIEQAEEIIND